MSAAPTTGAAAGRGRLWLLAAAFAAIWFSTLQYRSLVRPDEGRYGFRRWSVTIPLVADDLIRIGARATNVNGAVQPEMLDWNPGGYARNVIERITLRAQ